MSSFCSQRRDYAETIILEVAHLLDTPREAFQFSDAVIALGAVQSTARVGDDAFSLWEVLSVCLRDRWCCCFGAQIIAKNRDTDVVVSAILSLSIVAHHSVRFHVHLVFFHVNRVSEVTVANRQTRKRLREELPNLLYGAVFFQLLRPRR